MGEESSFILLEEDWTMPSNPFQNMITNALDKMLA